MALTTVQVHGEILELDGLTPAVGTVTFRTLIELRDVVDNIVYPPAAFVATLDLLGEFTIVLPATDNPDVLPLNWVYQVYINTATWTRTQYVQLPFAPGVTEFADLTPLDYDPCTGITAAAPFPPDPGSLFVLKSGDTMTGNLIINANLQVNGDAGVSDDLTVGDDLSVLGDVGVTGLLTANSASIGTLSGLTANFTTGTFGDLNVTDDLVVGDDAQITGDLNVDGTLTAEYQGVNGDVMRLISSVLSTGVTSGGVLTANGDPTKIDISAMTGWIIDYNASGAIGATNPMITYVTYPGTTALTPTFAPTTWFSIDSAGALIQQANRPTPAERRQRVVLGTIASSGGIMVQINTLPAVQSQPLQQYQDLTEGLRGFSTSGNLIGPNGVNLNFNKTSGTVFFRGFDLTTNYQDPHNSPLAAQTPAQFRHLTALPGSTGPVTTTLAVGSYDPGGLGVVTPVGGGANTSTNFRVWIAPAPSPAAQILVQYGQNTYASLAAARSGIGTGSYIPNPIVAAAVLLGWISVIRTATNLSDPTQAIFTQAGKFATP